MEQQLKKIQICLYVIIALLLVNTIALFAAIKDPNTTTSGSDSEENYDYDVSMFETIDADGLVEAYNWDETKVVYFGRSTCGFCVQFLPVLQQAQQEYGYKTLYVDIETIDADGQNKIMGLDSFFEENYGSTPITVLVKDGKIIDSEIGYVEYSTFTSMLEENGF